MTSASELPLSLSDSLPRPPPRIVPATNDPPLPPPLRRCSFSSSILPPPQPPRLPSSTLLDGGPSPFGYSAIASPLFARRPSDSRASLSFPRPPCPSLAPPSRPPPSPDAEEQRRDGGGGVQRRRKGTRAEAAARRGCERNFFERGGGEGSVRSAEGVET